MSGWALRHCSKDFSHSARSALPRWATSRTWSMISGSIWKDFSGSKPRISLVAATSSAPSAEPWMPPVFCLVGEGQPMMVLSAIRDGLSVTLVAATIAS